MLGIIKHNLKYLNITYLLTYLNQTTNGSINTDNQTNNHAPLFAWSGHSLTTAILYGNHIK